ncbi:MAG: DNA primase [Xanthomonadaceae bacterium]|nr:DNA primase [Xanthomonadaceae bacterium]MDP2184310.1 DNA primase [Xanthomonadales bacterium]MDZ4115606.1 DNA primase [Xanthomonadaceae bacterium]MDZ4377731.1 DNA primase [Xanthomonadaceae bacterium]
MARLSDAFLDDLLARTDIVEVIGARVEIKRAGREYSGRCPFHDERSPSFTVSPTKQFYHCFGCGAHGTAIKFLMEYDRMEFLDAIEELAKRAGIEVPHDAVRRDSSEDSQPLYAALDAATRFFAEQLHTSSSARAYLDRRGVDEATRERFAIGYAPDGWEGLKNALGGDAQRMAVLDRVGLLSKNDAGRVYDKFRARLMFPIHDRRGRVIAFGGRVLEKEDGPKYLNSPETSLFHKGRELYGLWQVRQAHSKIPQLVVVEGYMDVVSLFQYGVDTAVATLGTATTPDHAELLFRNAPDVHFCFDGDRAGRDAAWKAVESILPRMRDGRQAFFLFLPDGEDPDSIVRKEGATGFEQRIRGAMPLYEFYFNERRAGLNLATATGRGAFADRCKPDLDKVPDGGFRNQLFARLTDTVGDKLWLRKTLGASTSASGTRASATPKRSLVRSAIVLLLQQPALALQLQTPFRFAALRQPGIALLVELLQLVVQRPDIGTGSLVEYFAGRDEHAALQKLAMQSLPGDASTLLAEFTDAIAQLDRQTLAQRIGELQLRQRDPGLNDAEKDELRALLSSRR